MINVPRRRRRGLTEQQKKAAAALQQSVDGLHAEVVQLGTVSERTPVVQDLAGRLLHWQERNHFGPNFARIMGEPRK